MDRTLRETLPPEGFGKVDPKRIRMMRGNRKKNTRPEVRVRQRLHCLGYRFRLHKRGLPGSPDIVLPRHGSVILVHGCFWHRHTCRSGRKVPRTRSAYWIEKFARNKRRDSHNVASLRRLGWKVLVIWECQTSDQAKLDTRLQRFLKPS